jgi:hypothetical protein
MGQGFPITTSTKEKLNTRSSTEAKLVSMDDLMPAICWTRYFMEAQGYKVAENIVYQEKAKCHPLGKEWKSFEQQAHKAY